MAKKKLTLKQLDAEVKALLTKYELYPKSNYRLIIRATIMEENNVSDFKLWVNYSPIEEEVCDIQKPDIFAFGRDCSALLVKLEDAIKDKTNVSNEDILLF